MPSNILAADVLFPHLTEKQSTDEKFTVVTDYLYMLLEQLRYTLANLGEGNFNETELANIGNVITEPVFIQLQGLEGQMASLSVTAEEIRGTVGTLDGKYSTLSVTVDEISGTVGTLNGKYSTLSQTANKINWLVDSGTSASDFTMTDRAINLVSENINLTGYVTFESLKDSETSTIIAGGDLRTCLLRASEISSCMLEGCYYNMIVNTTYGYPDGELRMYLDSINDDPYTSTRLGGIKAQLGYRSGTIGGARARVCIYANDTMGETGGVDIDATQIRLYGNIYLNDTLVSAKTS
jgi:hypothetical protein